MSSFYGDFSQGNWEKATWLWKRWYCCHRGKYNTGLSLCPFNPLFSSKLQSVLSYPNLVSMIYNNLKTEESIEDETRKQRLSKKKTGSNKNQSTKTQNPTEEKWYVYLYIFIYFIHKRRQYNLSFILILILSLNIHVLAYQYFNGFLLSYC